MALVTEVYRQTRTFPSEEMYGLVAQARRSAVSVPSNIAEGYARNSTQDYIRFLRVAMGSLYELQTQLEISVNLKHLSQQGFPGIYGLSREIERLLRSLIEKLDAKRR